MLERYFLYLCLVVFIVQTAGRAVAVVGASLYDVMHAQAPKLQLKRRRARLSIVILAHNSAHTITSCLDSIFEARPRNIDVIVVDNKSRDETCEIVQQYKTRYRKRPIRLIKKRVYASEDAAYYSALSYVHGKNVLLLAGEDSISRKALLAASQNVATARKLHVQGISYPSLIGLLQRYYLAAEDQVFKALHIRHEAQEVSNAMIWPKLQLRQAMQGRHVMPAQYDEDIVIYRASPLPGRFFAKHSMLTHKGARFTSLLRFIAFMEPVVLTYFFYLAYTGRNSTLFLLSIAATAGWFGLAVAAEKHLSFGAKMNLIFMTPVLYILHYIERVAFFVIEVSKAVVHSLRSLRSRLLQIKPVQKFAPKLQNTEWVA